MDTSATYQCQQGLLATVKPEVTFQGAAVCRPGLAGKGPQMNLDDVHPVHFSSLKGRSLSSFCLVSAILQHFRYFNIFEILFILYILSRGYHCVVLHVSPLRATVLLE